MTGNLIFSLLTDFFYIEFGINFIPILLWQRVDPPCQACIARNDLHEWNWLASRVSFGHIASPHMQFFSSFTLKPHSSLQHLLLYIHSPPKGQGTFLRWHLQRENLYISQHRYVQQKTSLLLHNPYWHWKRRQKFCLMPPTHFGTLAVSF